MPITVLGVDDPRRTTFEAKSLRRDRDSGNVNGNPALLAKW